MILDREKLLATEENAYAFVKTYPRVSRQIRKKNLDCAAQKNEKPCRTHMPGAPGPADRDVRGLSFASNDTKLKKTAVPDGITSKTLRHIGPRAKGELLSLINLSSSSAEVPRKGRTATVILITKTGRDHRPLSNIADQQCR